MEKVVGDLKVYGDGDIFTLVGQTGSEEQGWIKSTRVCNVEGGCIVNVSTKQRKLDGNYTIAEALTYVPNVNIDTNSKPYKMVYVL